MRRAAQKAGDDLAERQRAGDIAAPRAMRPWDFSLGGTRQQKAALAALPTTAYLGIDAFSVPMQKPGGKKAEHRMMYVGILYTPDKERAHYLADFDLSLLAAQMRSAADALGLGAAARRVAISDAGNGLEEALLRNFDDGLLCIMDWYHAAEHLHEYARCLRQDEGEAQAWAEEAKTVLWEQGGKGLGEWLGGQAEPADAGTAEELRKLRGYFKGNEHRTDYPEYRKQGLDVGSGPTEAACKIVGARLKGSGMRWVEQGAARMAPLRALYLSGDEAWKTYWCLAS